ncbi:hypothetical protein AAG570_013460 [Ranatra chinensis]|uniref:RNB domain-containing protein n=1 Tax=Ranatra chinensis TaxID=642074 RepID=A0ABD0YC85_9HEMI
MLLANVSVAEVLLKAYPKLAFLRRHSPPKQNMMEKLEQSLHKLGIFLDISSSGQLHQSIWHHATDPLRMRVLNLLCSKPMNKAEYHCTGEHHHYALNVPHYTHFTSPIRRFADIVVHRLLAAHLGSSPLPSWTVEDLAG